MNSLRRSLLINSPLLAPQWLRRCTVGLVTATDNAMLVRTRSDGLEV